MKLSLDWIQEYVGTLPDSTKAVGLKMTLATAEIEGHENIGSDTVYDIDNKSLTHRPDLWGHYGFAREVAAVYQRELAPLQLGNWAYPASSQDPLAVSIDCDSSLCPRYNGLVIEGIQVGPSPDWLQQRLEKAGARPINNIVDLTNYILFELGQPLHAFDRHKLSGDQIRVRLAAAGESIATLDGGQHTLSSEMLVIADAHKPVAIAGVMGGANSEVDDNTTCLVLESANFHPTHVRRTAAALGIRTESSMRFEKGLDPYQTQTAVRRFVTLLLEICPGAKVISPLLDVGFSAPAPIEIASRFSFINQRLGTELPAEQIAGILQRLHFKLEIKGDDFVATVPSFRATGDISMPMDLVEEVGRIYGYDNITPKAPLIPVQPVQPSPLHALQRQLRTVLSRDLAFHEVYNYGFVGQKLLEQVGLSPEGHLALANPLASDQHLLRTSLIPNMLKITAENLRFNKRFRLYELERVFNEAASDTAFEHDQIMLCGLICDSAWKHGPAEIYLATKGVVEDLLAQLPAARQASFVPAESVPAWAHPGRSAEIRVGETLIGRLAQLHPQTAQNLGIKAGVGLFELDIAALLALPQPPAKQVSVQKYPTVPFDISVITAERTLIADVEALIRSLDDKVRDVQLFDVYVGENIGPGHKSLAFTITFAAPDHTLQPAEIDDLQNRVMDSLDAAGHKVRRG